MPTGQCQRAPNRDTGHLSNQVERIEVALLKVKVTSNASYSMALKFRTSRMAERPFMRPPLAKDRAAVADLVRRVVNQATQGD